MAHYRMDQSLAKVISAGCPLRASCSLGSSMLLRGISGNAGPHSAQHASSSTRALPIRRFQPEQDQSPYERGPAQPTSAESVVQRIVSASKQAEARGRSRSPKSSGVSPAKQSPANGLEAWHINKNGVGHLHLDLTIPATRTAGRIAHILRDSNLAMLHFTSALAVHKALRVLALSNHFLHQHQAAASFVFAPDGARGQQGLFAPDSQQSRLLNQSHSSQQQQQQPGTSAVQATHDGAQQPRQHQGYQQDQQEEWLQQESRSQQEHEGQPQEEQQQQQVSSQQAAGGLGGAGGSASRQPGRPRRLANAAQSMRFSLLSWARPLEQPELDLRPSSALQLLEFALDVRREWRRTDQVVLDSAFSLADNLRQRLGSSVPEKVVGGRAGLWAGRQAEGAAC
ncbi:hypothetical protein HaLaN_08371 [Haematococcus lacustris]|uniref:Uncharacterized protein n=1 Tax=Haematococcus lacustris TaxID=44745 RepID=A0A699YQL8_HAELA|nr:hypothetical protein HaLaN_08371 [Haematococcus lacustris]